MEYAQWLQGIIHNLFIRRTRITSLDIVIHGALSQFPCLIGRTALHPLRAGAVKPCGNSLGGDSLLFLRCCWGQPLGMYRMRCAERVWAQAHGTHLHLRLWWISSRLTRFRLCLQENSSASSFWQADKVSMSCCERTIAVTRFWSTLLMYISSFFVTSQKSSPAASEFQKSSK